MRAYKEAFDTLAHYCVDSLTNNDSDINQELAEILLAFHEHLSLAALTKTTETSQFQFLKSQFLTASGTYSLVTVEYLKHFNSLLMLVTAALESNIEIHLQDCIKFLKFVFAFHHINYARYNSAQHMFFSRRKIQ